MKVFMLKSQGRERLGKSGARATRRAGQVPAVIYGEGGVSEHVSVPERDFRGAVEHGARVIDLDRGGPGPERVLLVDVQYDALGLALVHADFLRLDPEHEIELNVPLELEGSPKGLADGGVLTVLRDTLAVRCLPRDIPERVPVDVSGLGLGDSVVAGSVALPEGVALAEEATDTLVAVAVPRAVKAAADEEAAEAEGEAAAEPEAKAKGA
jgi:large subunit ribosomal protein L25